MPTTTAPEIVKRAAIYVRLSADRNMTGDAVRRQTQDSRDLARIKGFQVTEVFDDNDQSASKKGHVRPEFDAMLARIAAGEFDAVIVWHLDRLARKMSDLTKVIEAGQPHKLNIQAVEGISLDLSDPTGVAVAQILVAIAGMEVAHKGARQKAANEDRAKRGLPFSSLRTFGYELDGSLREVEAAVVRELFERYNAGQNISVLTRWINTTGLTSAATRQGRNGWSRTGIRAILTNPRYAGKMTYQGTVMSDDGTVVVDLDTFETAQIALAEKKPFAPGGSHRRHLGSSVYRCGVCGEPMISGAYSYRSRTDLTASKTKYTYTCKTRGHVSRTGHYVDRAVETFMVRVLDDPDVRARFAGDRDNALAMTTQKRVQYLRGQLDKFSDMLAAGTMVERQFVRQTKAANEELITLNRTLADLGQRSALTAILGAEDPAKAWLDHPDIWTRVRVLDELLEVTVLKPAARGYTGKFDPSSVVIKLRADEAA